MRYFALLFVLLAALVRSHSASAATFVVQSLADTDGQACGATDCTLRQAINAANADITTPDVIRFAPDVRGTINLTTTGDGSAGFSAFLLIGQVDIQGPGADVLNVHRAGAQGFRVFNVDGRGVASLSGLTISGGGGGTSAGGGILNQGDLTLSDCTVSGNTATDIGGGILHQGARMVVQRCTISGNTANTTREPTGGGIHCFGGPVDISNSTISGNSAPNNRVGNRGSGGGILTSSPTTITNCTITDNLVGTTTSASGLSISGDTTTISNTIVADNRNNAARPDVVRIRGTLTSDGFNFIGNAGTILFTGTGDMSGTSLAPLDPVLGALAFNGGPTQTHALLSGSPSINSGRTSLPTDQRGAPRSGADDIGAFEIASDPNGGAGLVVTTARDETLADGLISLREAISNANASPDLSTISFASPLFDTPQIISLSGELAVNSNVFITGPGARLLSVRRPPTATSDFRVFNLGTNTNVTLSGMTIAGGRLTATNGQGGGILKSGGGSLRLDGVSVEGNSVSVSRGSIGGGGLDTFAPTNILNSTFSGNLASSGNADGGGAIRVASGVTLDIANSTFSGNSTSTFGGAIHSRGALNVRNSTFTLNRGIGGGIFIQSGTLSLNNSIVTGNTSPTGPDISGTINSGDYNLIGNTQDVIFSGSPSHNKTGVDAKLGPLADNGGQTDTHAPAPNSPAIDAGNSSLSTDQRGEFRPADLPAVANAQGGNGSDIGSVEFDAAQSGPNFLVNTTRDGDDGVCSIGDCTLREAINAANGNTDDSAITFDATVFADKQTLTLTLGNLPGINTNLTVSGPTTAGAGVTVAGTTPNSGSIFQTNSGTVSLSDLSVTNGFIAVAARGGTTTLARCTLSGNNLGIDNTATVTAQNCTVTGNSATGITNAVGTINVQSCTITGNRVGIDNFRSATANVTNSIVVDNRNGNNVSGITDEGFNITSGSAADAGLDPNGLQDNGGPVQTIALLSTSPAIDAGKSTFATDARGLKRPVDIASVDNAQGSNGSDIGSFELQDIGQSAPNFVVNSIDDHDDGVCGVNDCTLREAVGAANRNGAATDTISFDLGANPPQVGYVVQLASALPALNGDLTISGPAPTPLTIRGEGQADPYRVFTVNDGNIVIFNDLTISNGYDTNSAANSGGGIQNRGTLTLNRCTISGNSATGGGGIFNYPNSGGTATLTLNQCTVSGNTASFKGGGILNLAQGATARLFLNGCTIAYNSASAGGGVSQLGTSAQVTNSIIALNTGGATPDGDGAFTSNGFNLIGKTNNTTGFTQSTDKTGTSAAPLDPKLGPLRDNGGATDTIALLPTSPAINAGDPAITSGFDQRGNGFPRVRGGRVDIGSFETQNSAPIAKDDSYNVAEDALLSVNAATGVLSNDTDPDANTTLSISSNTNPANGTLSLNKTDGSFIYRPNANFFGSDSFSYTVSDGSLSATATVSISVSEVNDAPTLDKPADVQVNEDAGAQTVNLTGISSGPANESGQTLVVSATSDNAALVANPTVTYSSPDTSGTLSFSSAANASGTASITVTVSDNGTSNSAADPKTTTQTFVITVKAQNDAPVITSVSIAPTNPKTNDVLKATIAATDLENDSLTFSYVWKKNGVVVPNEKMDTLDLSKPGNGDKNDILTVEVTPNDGTVDGDSQSASVKVGNTAPVVTSITIMPLRPNTSSILTANPVATDADGDTLSFSYAWRKNGVVIPNEKGATLDLSEPGVGDENDRISVSVVALDGTNPSRGLTSSSVKVFNFAPAIVSVSPQGATDQVGDVRTFVLTASDPNGVSDITELSLLINQKLDLKSGALLRYDIASGLLFLKRGDAFLPGIPIGAAASAADVLDNGALRINGSEVSVTLDADGLSLSVPATIRGGLVGTNIFFARAQDVSGTSSSPHQGGFVQSGTYTVQPQFPDPPNNIPTLSKLSPSAVQTTLPSSGVALAPQSFTFYARDEDGAADIDSFQFLAGRTPTGKGTANFVFFPRTRRLYLRSDDGRTLLGGIPISTAGVLENSQVRLDVFRAQFLIYPDGKLLGLRLPIQAKTGLIGENTVWLRVQDRSGALAVGGDARGLVPSGRWAVSRNASNSPATSSGNS